MYRKFLFSLVGGLVTFVGLLGSDNASAANDTGGLTGAQVQPAVATNDSVDVQLVDHRRHRRHHHHGHHSGFSVYVGSPYYYPSYGYYYGSPRYYYYDSPRYYDSGYYYPRTYYSRGSSYYYPSYGGYYYYRW